MADSFITDLSVGVALTSLFASDELAKNGRISGGWPVVCLPLSGLWSVRAQAGVYYTTYSCRCVESAPEEVILQETRRGRRALQILSFPYKPR